MTLRVLDLRRHYQWPHVRLGRTIRFTADQVAEIITAHSQEPEQIPGDCVGADATLREPEEVGMSTDLDPVATVGGTTVRIGDLALIGTAVLNLAVTADLMRHASPVGSMEYAEPPDAMPWQVVCDFTAWCGGDKAAGAQLLGFLHESGWYDRVFSALDGPATDLGESA